MILDFHMHERTFSGDSRINLKEMVREAKIKGLDGICITDHDQIGLIDYANKLSIEENFPIFVGVEYLSIEGDILAFGINEMPKPHMYAQDFIDYVEERGGITIAAHPYRANSRGLGDELYRVKRLTGVEVLNGSTEPRDNLRAWEVSRDLGLKPTGASDCHNLMALGRFATKIDRMVSNVDELVEAFKYGEVSPVMLSGYIDAFPNGYERIWAEKKISYKI